MANISFGQRQLIVGNNKVGKTTLLSNIAKNFSINKNFSYLNVKNTYSFYSFIGSSRREFILHKSCHYFLNKKSNFFVDGTVSLDLYSQFISPFTVIFFCEQLSLNGLDTVHILDSLSNHAKIYRNMMLDLKRSPGREAYPGDIFYLHAKILEKYGQSSYCYNLGSMTGLPVTEIQKNNISDYITTNLISITDGQWFLSSLLRAKGMYPCLDINLSVSRIGNISHNSMLKYLGTVIRALVSEYTVLQEAQLFMSLDKIKLKRYLQSCKMYNTFF
jgi:F-type H+-transporting ATPase subunit alpha